MRTTTDIVLLTEDKYVAPQKRTDYINNILKEDAILIAALEKHGLHIERKSWSDPAYNWEHTKYALFRTTWDYFNRLDEFMQWLDATSIKTIFINSVETIRWNLDKHYLLDLQKRSIPVVETYIIEKGTRTTLIELLETLHWPDAILKPAISGAARHTYKLHAGNMEYHEEIFQSLIRKEAMLLQPFLFNILTEGEITLVVIDGKFTHAVRKNAKAGDFRVQDDFGGIVTNYLPTKHEIALAEDIIQRISPIPLYARVDLISDNNNALSLSELELIEPELWFRTCPAAADLLASTLARLF